MSTRLTPDSRASGKKRSGPSENSPLRELGTETRAFGDGGGAEDFTVGICAAGRSAGLPSLISTVRSEAFPEGSELAKIVVVASGCTEETLSQVRQLAACDDRIELIEQRERLGKANAINEIMRSAVGTYVIFLNSDAEPAPSAMSNLMEAIRANRSWGVVSGNPVIDTGTGVTHSVLALMWETHNECSHSLNDMSLSNHCTDELMVVRTQSMEELPAGIVNDGAFIAGLAYSKGYRVKFLQRAPVRVRVPSRIVDAIKQRRRILYGHLQVWSVLGTPPKTAESLAVLSPGLAFSLVSRTIARRPGFLLALPFALVCETISFLGAVADFKRKTDKHSVWEMVGD